MLKYDVDVNIKTEEGCTPLYLACNAGHYDTVLMLLEERKAKINLQLIIKGVLPELFALFTSTLWFINISMTS
jgi:ankyrin repeat protein